MRKLLLIIVLFLFGCSGSNHPFIDNEMLEENIIGDAKPYTELPHITYTNNGVIYVKHIR